MLYHLLFPLARYSIVFNVFRYVTFRSIGAFITSLILTLFLGPAVIRMLKKSGAEETVNLDLASLNMHNEKAGTPTMGGLIILIALMLSSLMWNNLTNPAILLMYVGTVWLGLLGFLDDYLKNFVKLKEGLLPKYKLLGQVTIALLITLAVYFQGEVLGSDFTQVQIPFFKETFIQLGIFFIPIMILFIVGTSNAVNLTDGLDGLAAGVIIFSALGLGVMSYLKGNFIAAEYLNLEHISSAGELTVYIAAMIGTLIGFLWFNSHPAQIFMGDTGSLSLGGILALLSILLKEQIFFIITGLIFWAETLSVILQRSWFKHTKKRYGEGRRLFLCAPVHHHFERQGLKESKIVTRFWIVAILLFAFGLSTIKLR